MISLSISIRAALFIGTGEFRLAQTHKQFKLSKKKDWTKKRMTASEIGLIFDSENSYTKIRNMSPPPMDEAHL